MRPSPLLVTSIVLTTLGAVPVLAQQDMSNVQIRTEKAGGNVYALFGRGGNIGLSVGEDGAFLIDDQFAPLTGKILAAVGELTDEPVRFVINTHWHGDHTGGNENLGEAGATIVAHRNVRQRMSVEQVMEAFGRTVPPSPPAALPVITFDDGVTFHQNGDTIRVIHVANAHTDGDSIIYFEEANVLHMGDTFFHQMYPFIDLGSGGSIDGVIAAAAKGLEIADGETRIIPGHGPLAGRAELESYHGFLTEIRDRIAKMIDEGKSLEAIVAAKPTSEWDAEWGGGFIRPQALVETVHRSLTR